MEFRTQRLLSPVSGGDPRTVVNHGVWWGPKGVGNEKCSFGRQGTLAHLWGKTLRAFREAMSSWLEASCSGWLAGVSLTLVTWFSYFSCQWGSCLLPESHSCSDKINFIVNREFSLPAQEEAKGEIPALRRPITVSVREGGSREHTIQQPLS